MSEAMFWTCRGVTIGEIRLVRSKSYFGTGGLEVAVFKSWEDACATASALSAGLCIGFCRSTDQPTEYLNADGTVTLKPKGTERMRWYATTGRLLGHATPADEPTPIEPNVCPSPTDSEVISFVLISLICFLLVVLHRTSKGTDYNEKLYHDTLSTLKRTRNLVRALMALLPDELKGCV